MDIKLVKRKKQWRFDHAQRCEYVATFDADFQPASDFLMRTVPFLIHNIPEIALVQARWKFVNADECLMTRIQEMPLNYHFKIEKQSGSSTFAFFGFNGTAGVWRILAINEVEGWKERPTVEDMDLAVRATLAGWKFVYVGNIKFLDAVLGSPCKKLRFKCCWIRSWYNCSFFLFLVLRKVPLRKRFFLVYNFFLARRIISHNVIFFFYCAVIPLSVFFHEIQIPRWGVVYIPTAITLLNSVGTPSSIHLTIFWILFKNVMSWHRCKAVFIGLTEADRVNEWIVTEKLGDTMKTKPISRTKFWERFHFADIAIGTYLILCASYDYAFNNDHYFMYIFPLALFFLIMGFGYVGTFVPESKEVNITRIPESL